MLDLPELEVPLSRINRPGRSSVAPGINSWVAVIDMSPSSSQQGPTGLTQLMGCYSLDSN
jgi:hypothetical protein